MKIKNVLTGFTIAGTLLTMSAIPTLAFSRDGSSSAISYQSFKCIPKPKCPVNNPHCPLPMFYPKGGFCPESTPLPSIKPIPYGTIQGNILLTPTCPVQKIGSNCSAPYQATVVVKSKDGTGEITRFTSDKDGNFKLSLPIGTYLFTPLTPNGHFFPRAETQMVNVEQGKYINITIIFDTGIR